MPARNKPVDVHDPVVWRHGVHALEVFIGARGTSNVPDRVRANGIELGRWVQACRTAYWEATLSHESAHYLEAQPGWDWGAPQPRSWRRGFLALRRFVTENGTALVPTGVVVDGISLPAWCDHQRASYVDQSLHPARIRLLETIAGWQWDADALRWESGFSVLLTYTRTHDPASIRRGLRVAGIDLGAWVQRCRQDYRAGTLSADRVAALEAIEGWRWGRSVDTWSDGVAALTLFVADHGHASPTQRTRINGFPVGTWVNERRREHHAGDLALDKAVFLATLPGWQWAPQRVDAWERGIAALTEYVATTGHAHPARGETLDGYPIGDWVSTQRGKHRNGGLSPDRVTALESLPGWRWSRSVAPSPPAAP